MVKASQGGLPADEVVDELDDQELPEDEQEAAEESDEQVSELDPNTQALINRAVAKAVAQVRGEFAQDAEKMRRTIQSQGARSANQLQKQLGQVLAPVTQLASMLKEAGHELPPDMVEKLQNRVLREALTKVEEDTDDTDQPVRRRQQQPLTVDEAASLQLGYAALRQMELVLGPGGMIEDNDPEYDMLALDSDDPAEILQSVKDGAIAKAKRLGLRVPNEAARRQARRPAAPKGPGGGKPPWAGKTATDLISEGLRQSDMTKRARR